METDILTPVVLASALGDPRRHSPTADDSMLIQDFNDISSGHESCIDEHKVEEDNNRSTGPRVPSLSGAAVESRSKPFVCDVPGCQKSFVKANFLEMHIRVHTNERPFMCTIEGCGRSYTRSWHLRRHLEKAHSQGKGGSHSNGDTTQEGSRAESGSQRHQCLWDGCSKEYQSQDALKKHVARVHEGREHVGREKPGERWSCSYCELSFAKHVRLKAHLFQHTGKMPFSCQRDGCGKEFSLQSKLKAHEKTHIGYECEKCPGVRYPTWSALRKHFKEIHNVKRCPKCDKTFTRSVHLETHMATHDIEREAFVCSYEGCNKSYFELKNLHAHQKAAHDGVRFACVECAKEFRSKQALRRHGRKCLAALGHQPLSESCNDIIDKRPVKTGVDRKPRKDKGVHRKSAATWLSGWDRNNNDLDDSSEAEHHAILQGNGQHRENCQGEAPDRIEELAGLTDSRAFIQSVGDQNLLECDHDLLGEKPLGKKHQNKGPGHHLASHNDEKIRPTTLGDQSGLTTTQQKRLLQMRVEPEEEEAPPDAELNENEEAYLDGDEVLVNECVEVIHITDSDS